MCDHPGFQGLVPHFTQEECVNREALDRPFEAVLVETRRRAIGQQISSVEGAE